MVWGGRQCPQHCSSKPHPHRRAAAAPPPPLPPVAHSINLPLDRPAPSPSPQWRTTPRSKAWSLMRSRRCAATCGTERLPRWPPRAPRCAMLWRPTTGSGPRCISASSRSPGRASRSGRHHVWDSSRLAAAAWSPAPGVTRSCARMTLAIRWAGSCERETVVGGGVLAVARQLAGGLSCLA